MVTIGFIGLGIMGRPMARNLLRARFPLVVHSRSAGPAAALAVEGAREARSVGTLAAECDVVITMLTDSAAVREVIGGAGGVFNNIRSGALVIDMGTTSPPLSRELAAIGQARGVALVDAPVSGGEAGAREGTLSIMVGAEPVAFERARPILEHLGKRVVHVGGPGAGQVAKAANQVIVGVTIQAVAEALALAARAGVDPARVREALLGGYAASRILEVHGERMLTGNMKPGGRVRTQHKDMRIVLELAQGLGLELPATALVEKLYEELIERGEGDLDHSALVRLMELDLPGGDHAG